MLRLCLQSLYWSNCSVWDAKHLGLCGSGLPCQNTHMVSGIWTNGSETWMGTVGFSATGGVGKAIWQIMIVNDTGTQKNRRGEVELFLSSQQKLGIRSYKYAKCQLYIFIHVYQSFIFHQLKQQKSLFSICLKMNIDWCKCVWCMYLGLYVQVALIFHYFLMVSLPFGWFLAKFYWFAPNQARTASVA